MKEIRDKLEFQSTIINIKLSLSDKVIQSKFSDYVVKQTELEEFLNQDCSQLNILDFGEKMQTKIKEQEEAQAEARAAKNRKKRKNQKLRKK